MLPNPTPQERFTEIDVLLDQITRCIVSGEQASLNSVVTWSTVHNDVSKHCKQLEASRLAIIKYASQLARQQADVGCVCVEAEYNDQCCFNQRSSGDMVAYMSEQTRHYSEILQGIRSKLVSWKILYQNRMAQSAAHNGAIAQEKDNHQS